jgi:nucleotide-binding universal stress UspA family protein
MAGIGVEESSGPASSWHQQEAHVMNQTRTSLPIVVGVDGSAFSQLALDWAVEEAHRRDRPLLLVSAWAVDYTAGLIGRLIPYLREECDRILDDASRRVASTAPWLTVSRQVVQGQAASALTAASTGGSLVVVGCRGLGSVQAVLAGSTSVAVAAHARCPVVVVHETSPPDGPARRVVVGVDGSPASADALHFAFDQADARGLGLTAVHAWGVTLTAETFAVAGLGESVDDLNQEQEAVTAEWIEPWRAQFPTVDVQTRITEARPVDALVDASRDAELLVVGSRGHGGFTGLLLGSVSRGLLHRAHCPVAVTRAHVVREG